MTAEETVSALGSSARSAAFASEVPLSVGNLMLILAQDPALRDLLGRDEFASTDVLRGPPPQPIGGAPAQPGPYPRPWTPADVAHVQFHIQRTWTHQAARRDVEDAMTAIAACRRFHPVRDWLATLEWDNYPRLDFWLSNAFGAPDDAYHGALGAHFLVAAVRRVRQPGVKFDHMPILEGPQGLGKSRAVRALFGGEWFTDSLPAALESRDAALGLQGAWCVEFAEIEQIIRTEVEVIKAFLSRPVDRFRAPYGRAFLSYPRQSVMLGTTNDNDYLRDATGSRRFWPVRCKRADVAWIEANRAQIWAEAAAREEFGEGIWFTEPEVIRPAHGGVVTQGRT
jgi:putative DNA primase/helicase